MVAFLVVVLFVIGFVLISIVLDRAGSAYSRWSNGRFRNPDGSRISFTCHACVAGDHSGHMRGMGCMNPTSGSFDHDPICNCREAVL